MEQDEGQQKPKQPNRSIVLAGSRGLEFRTMDDMWRFCVACAASKEFKDIQTPEQALIRLQAGLEVGLSPIWSLTNVMVVNGKPSIWGDAALALCQAHPDFQDCIEEFIGDVDTDEFGAQCIVYRKGREPKSAKFTVADAKLAGLWGKRGRSGEPTPWVTYPKRMLKMRARTFGLRDAFADALRGLSVVEELRDVEAAPRKEIKAMILPDEAGGGEKVNGEKKESGKEKETDADRLLSLPTGEAKPVQEPEVSNAPVAPYPVVSSTPGQVAPCDHAYSRSMNQPYPRCCIMCGEVETKPKRRRKKRSEDDEKLPF